MNVVRAKTIPPATHRRAVTSRGASIPIDDCHRQILSMLDELSVIVTKLESDGIDREIRDRAAKVATFFSTTAREHHEEEERHIFPALVKGARPEVVQAILRLQQDHDWLEEAWFELAPHVHAIAAGRRSCDIGTIRDGLAALDALYRDHIELEETVAPAKAQAAAPARHCSAM